MSELWVADSFRVRQNASTGVAEVRGWGYHLERFARASASALEELEAQPEQSLDDFIVEASERIDAFGEGFPRLELWLDPDETVRWGVSERPLPALADELELRTAPSGPDRPAPVHPDRKGPNLERYLDLNHRVGAEALLLDERGEVLEGATTSVIWWVGEDRAARVASDARVPSVTERLVAEAVPLYTPNPSAAGAGGAIEAERVVPQDLARHEVWAVNALHGIRVVTHIDGNATPEPDPRRLSWFRAVLDHAWEPVLNDGRTAATR